MPDAYDPPAPLQDCNGIIDPSAFPIPTLDHVEFRNQAHDLRKAGEAMAETGDDIVSAWGGLSQCYTAPESETLYSALDPVSVNGAEVESATGRAATALDEFAEEVQRIKMEWFSLQGRASSFRADVEGDEDWDQSDHWFTRKSSNVDKSNALKGEAEALIRSYERAQRTCANAINAELLGRTHFSSSREAELDLTLNNPFVYDSVNTGVDIPSTWGPGASADQYWHQDALDSVWDFGVGAAQGVGGAVGAHSSEGWFEQSWGDSLKEYHWDNLTAAASLVGMYDAESDSLTWSGGETAREAWMDLAHAAVPWEEWDDRPGYVFATGVLNLGSLAVGVALTATGVGAAVGAPLLAWRGMDILDGMGSSGRGGGSGVDLPNLPDLPASGGNGLPVINIDTSGLSPTQLADMKAALERLPFNQSNGNEIPGGNSGSPHPNQGNQTDGPRAGDLAQGERITSPEPSSRGDESSAGSKKSEGRNPDNWVGEVGGGRPNNRGSEGQLAPVGGRGSGDTLTESRSNPIGPPTQANANRIDPPGSGTRSGNEVPDNKPGDRGADVNEQAPTVVNQEGNSPESNKDRTDALNDGVESRERSDEGSPERREGGAPPPPPNSYPLEGIESTTGYPIRNAFPEAERYPDRLPGPGEVRPGAKIRPTVEELSKEGRVGEGWEHFQAKEKEIAEILARHGIDTKSVQESTVEGKKSPEAVMSGTNKTIEFKILESLSKNTIKTNMRKGREQSPNLVLDLRNVSASRDDVLNLTRDPLRQYGGDLDELIIIAEDYIIIWP